MCVPVFVFLHIPECVSALFDLSLSADKCSETGDRQTPEYIYEHLQTDSDLSRRNDLLFQNLPSQPVVSPDEIRLIKSKRDMFVGRVCARLIVGLLSPPSSFTPALPLLSLSSKSSTAFN